jgi:MFS transporter, FSR family, fosmidomycin resistance protein
MSQIAKAPDPTVSTDAQAPSLSQDAKVMGLVGLAHASSHFSHLLLPPLFPLLMQEFSLSFADVGWLTTLFFVVSGVGQALSGLVVDRVGAQRVMFISLALFMASSLVAGTATSYPALLFSAVLAGLGNAPFHPVDFTILNQRVSAARLGHAFSVHGLTGNLGWALAPVWLVGFSALAGWRAACLSTCGLYALVLAILWWQREHLRTEVVARPADDPRSSDWDYLRLPVVWMCFAFFLCTTVTMAVVQTFSPSILRALHGVSFEAATATLTAYMLAGALGMLLGGFVAHHQARSERVVAICMAAGALLLLLCASGRLGAQATMALLAATGFAVGVGGPSRDLMIRRATPRGATGRVYGTVYSGLDVGFALGPVCFALLMDRGEFGITLAGAGATLLLGVIAALAVGRQVRRAD